MSLNKKLRALADALPQTPKMENGKEVTYKVVVKGSVLLKENPNATLNGEPLNPSRHYTVTHTAYENHRKNLKRIYEQQGQAAVEKYVAKIKAYHHPVETIQKSLITKP